MLKTSYSFVDASSFCFKFYFGLNFIFSIKKIILLVSSVFRNQLNWYKYMYKSLSSSCTASRVECLRTNDREHATQPWTNGSGNSYTHRGCLKACMRNWDRNTRSASGTPMKKERHTVKIVCTVCMKRGQKKEKKSVRTNREWMKNGERARERALRIESGRCMRVLTQYLMFASCVLLFFFGAIAF